MTAVRAALAAHVATGVLPGAVALVARGEDVAVDVVGTLALGSAAPMQRDTLFRITSMTKPIAAAAALMLVDDGVLRLDEPIDAHLPELAARRVLRRLDGPLDDTVPAARAITVRDVLRNTMGFGMIFGPPDATPIQRAAEALDLAALGPPQPQRLPQPDEWLRRFATLPLMHQPGERWMYHTSSIVLSALVGRAARRPFADVVAERVLAPLGMVDTAFFVPPEQRARLATSYAAGATVLDPVDGQWSRPPAFASGGDGLVSTIDDYFAFAKLLRDGGGRLVSEASVRAMTSDQLDPELKARSPWRPADYWHDHGWGFGVTIASGSGGYGWDGGYGTAWRTFPASRTIAILMTQRAAFPAESVVHRDFWRAVAAG